jgi:hypothetical protein
MGVLYCKCFIGHPIEEVAPKLNPEDYVYLYSEKVEGRYSRLMKDKEERYKIAN